MALDHTFLIGCRWGLILILGSSSSWSTQRVAESKFPTGAYWMSYPSAVTSGQAIWALHTDIYNWFQWHWGDLSLGRVQLVSRWRHSSNRDAGRESLLLKAETVEIDMSVIGPNLSEVEQRQLYELSQAFSPVIHTSLGQTTIVRHEIHVGYTPTSWQHPYQISYSRRDVVRKDMRLADQVIRPSMSPWSSLLSLSRKMI